MCTPHVCTHTPLPRTTQSVLFTRLLLAKGVRIIRCVGEKGAIRVIPVSCCTVTAQVTSNEIQALDFIQFQLNKCNVKHSWGPFSQAGWEAKSSDRLCGEHFVSGKPSRDFNSVASKFKLCAQPLSAELKMSPHVLNCRLNGFYVLTLLSAMGSDAILQNLQRHISMQACGSWFCTDLESSQALTVTHHQHMLMHAVCQDIVWCMGIHYLHMWVIQS